MRRTTFAPTRRRRSPLPAIALVLLLLVVGLLVWAATKDTEVPLRTIEEDVTNAVAAK
jgi:hypothetical protein